MQLSEEVTSQDIGSSAVRRQMDESTIVSHCLPQLGEREGGKLVGSEVKGQTFPRLRRASALARRAEGEVGWTLRAEERQRTARAGLSRNLRWRRPMKRWAGKRDGWREMADVRSERAS